MNGKKDRSLGEQRRRNLNELFDRDEELEIMCVRERECEWIRRVIYSEPCPQSHPEGIRAYLVVGDSCEGDAFARRFDRLLSIDHPKAQLRKESSAKLIHLPPSLSPSLSFPSPSLSLPIPFLLLSSTHRRMDRESSAVRYPFARLPPWESRCLHKDVCELS